MKQKTTEELLCGQFHFFLNVSMRAISPGEGNLSVVERNQAMVGNGHSMSVAAEIFENLFRPAEWAFAMNYPMSAVEVANEDLKRLRIGKMLQLSVKANFPFSKSFFEGIYNLASKDLPECIFRQKESIPWIRRHPALTIKGQSAGRNYAVNMRVMLQLLRPGVKHVEESDVRSQEFGIAGNLSQCLSAETQQHRVDELLVLQCKLRKKPRHCKDDVRVGNREKLFLPPVDPTHAGVGLAFRAMPVST